MPCSKLSATRAAAALTCSIRFDPGVRIDRRVLSRDSLDILTDTTGGRAFSTVGLERAITQAEADARTHYSLEYQPVQGS